MSGEMVPRGTPPPTGDLFAPLTPLQGEVPEERGHSGTSLSSRAGSAVPRVDESSIYTLLGSFVLCSIMRILSNPKNYASNQSARVCIANCARFFILAIFGFPGVLPFPRDKRSLTARGPTPWRRVQVGGEQAREARPNRAPARDRARDAQMRRQDVPLFAV